MGTPPPAWQGRVPTGLPWAEGRLPLRGPDPAVFLWAGLPPLLRVQDRVASLALALLVQTGEPRRETACVNAGLFLLQTNPLLVFHKEARGRAVIGNFQKLLTALRACPQAAPPVLRTMPSLESDAA